MKPYYYCYISDESGKNVLEMPVTPADLPSRKLSADSEDFLTEGKGYCTIIGERLPWETEPEFVLPDAGKRQSYQLSEIKGKKLKNLLLTAMNCERPIRYSIVDKKGNYYINHLVQVTGFEHYIDKKRDWHISMSLKEWKRYDNNGGRRETRFNWWR